MIVGLCTSFREGRLVRGAIESLAAGCDVVLVLEGPAPQSRAQLGQASDLDRLPANVIVRFQSSDDDAAKRTYLVRWAQQVGKRKRTKLRGGRERLWLVWCDSDEVLLWSQYLPDYLAHLDQGGGEQNATGGFALRHVEPDGSVHLSWGRVLDGDQVDSYLVSGYQVQLVSGMVVALPLTPICSAGGIPLAPAEGVPRSDEERDAWLAQHRPPLAGEPHTLHRHPLRTSARATQRMHDDEGEWFERASR